MHPGNTLPPLAFVNPDFSERQKALTSPPGKINDKQNNYEDCDNSQNYVGYSPGHLEFRWRKLGHLFSPHCLILIQKDDIPSG